MIDSLVEKLNQRSMYSLLGKVKLHHFVSLNDAGIVGTINKPPFFVLYKTRQPLQHGELKAEEFSIALPLGRAYYLYSSGLDVGYVFALPSCQLRIADSYCSAVRNGVQLYPETPQVLLINQWIHAYSLSDESLFVVSNNLKHLSPGFRSRRNG